MGSVMLKYAPDEERPCVGRISGICRRRSDQQQCSEGERRSACVLRHVGGLACRSAQKHGEWLAGRAAHVWEPELLGKASAILRLRFTVHEG